MVTKKLHAKCWMIQSRFFFILVFFQIIFIPFYTISCLAEQIPRVALVLSGGSRGGAHIGALRVLEREGVPIDLIVGVSYGALVGGLYAAGYSVDDLERIVLETDWEKMADDNPDRRLLNLNRKPIGDRQMIEFSLEKLEPSLSLGMGIFAGQKMQQYLNRLTIGATCKAQNDFDRLPTPFRAIATDVLSGEQVVLKNGLLGSALRASVTWPGLFAPVSTEQTHLVDGGIVNNLPVDVALDAGVDFVIAIDCTTPLKSQKHEIENLVNVIGQIIGFQTEKRNIANRKRAHVLIRPNLEEFDAINFDQEHLLIPVGEKETEKHLDAVWVALQVLGISKRVGKPRLSVLPDNFDPKTWPGMPLDMVIDQVRIEGLERYVEEFFTSRLKKIIGMPISFRELDREAALLYATGLFQTVDYQILYQDDQTELVFLVREDSPWEVKVGFHYDNDFQFLMLGELARQNTFGHVSGFYFRGLGLSGKLNFAETGLIFHPSIGPRFLGEVQGWDQERLFFQNEQRQGEYREGRLRARLGIQELLHSWGSLKLGYQVERVHIRDAPHSIGNASEYLPSFWLSASVDTRDDVFLPEQGIYFQTRAKWAHRTFSHRQVQTQLAYFISPHSRLSLGVWSQGGYVTQSAPLYERFHLGGAGHFSMAASRLIGLRRDELKVFRFVSAGISIWNRVKFWADLSRSAVGIFYQGSLYNSVPDLNEENTYLHGFGVGFYIGTRFLGPIRVDIVSTDQKDIRIHTAIGFAF